MRPEANIIKKKDKLLGRFIPYFTCKYGIQMPNMSCLKNMTYWISSFHILHVKYRIKLPNSLSFFFIILASVRLPAEYSMLHYVTHGWHHTAAALSETACELRHVRLLQHLNICCSKTIYAAGGDVTQRWRHTPRRLLRMRAAAYCSILHCAAGTEQAMVE